MRVHAVFLEMVTMATMVPNSKPSRAANTEMIRVVFSPSKILSIYFCVENNSVTLLIKFIFDSLSVPTEREKEQCNSKVLFRVDNYLFLFCKSLYLKNVLKESRFSTFM